MSYLQVDVFAGPSCEGNPLAVFPDASGLTPSQMQAMAAELNLSESSFVTKVGHGSYDVRIFTPREELAFAGHPTLGTAWVLRHLGLLTEDEVVQRSGAGDTRVQLGGDTIWFQRTGASSPDLARRDLEADNKVTDALGLKPHDVGLDARELGRDGRLLPAFSDAGLEHFIVPLRTPEVLAAVKVDPPALAAISSFGAYCFSALGAGRLRARGFFPGTGIPEDPATGSAAASLGLYLARRLGKVDLEIEQGIEMGRPSKLFVKADDDRVSVGGRCRLDFEGELEAPPAV
jgi:trans-2,3-dihydro-3-hydroxyanthranilate isomerase